MGAIRLLAVPSGYWTAAEVRLAESLLTFDGSGSPMVVALMRLVNVFVRDPFASAVTLGVAASVAAAILIGLSCARIFGNAWAGAAVALAALLSPALLLVGPRPGGGSVAIAFVAATLYFFVAGRPELFALAAAAAIGSRPQMAPAMLVMFLIGIAVMPRKGRSLATFAVAMLLLFVPMAEVAVFDTSPQARRDLVVRFVAHPWGGKFLSYPLLAAAAAGAVAALKRHRHAAVLALAAFAAVHVAASVLTASAIDGVLPAVPAMIAVAFFAVAAFARWPMVAASLAAVFAGGSIAYTWPAVAQHARNEAPPVAAMRHADPRAMLIAAPDLAPFSRVALTPERLDDLATKRGVGVQLVVHGRSEEPGAVVFEQRAGDVCRKLVSDRFHVVSLVPLPLSQRYAVRSGVYHFESSPERAGWRWLAREAVIEPAGGGAARLRFRLPGDAPLPSNRLTVGGQVVEIARGATVDVALPHTSPVVIRAERSFTAADGRDLAVQLISVSTSL